MLLANSDEIENKLADDKGSVATLSKTDLSIREQITELYLAAYSRLPSDPELSKIESFVQDQSDKRKALEDVLWTILNTKEFMFNH